MKLTLLDVLALSKSGYKKKDIDELLQMELPEEPEPEPDPEPESPEKDPAQGDQDQDDPDSNKESIESYKTEIENLRKQIEKLQEDNRTKDRSGGLDPAAEREKRLLERSRSFM